YGSYVSDAWSAFASAFESSRDFPLNALQSLFADTKAVRGGIAFGANRRVFENFSYEHTVTDSGLLSIGHAVSDDVNAAIGGRLTPRETLTLASTYSRTEGGFNARPMTALRYSVALTSLLPRGGNNTAQLQVGSVADPLGLQSQDEFTFTDGLSLPIRSGSIYLGYAHNRVNPSLVQKLNRELDLLSPELQQLFLANPAGFIANELPPEIRALLESQVPVSDSVTLSFERKFGERWKAIPSVTFSRFVSEPQRGWTHFFGYGLTYQLTPSLLVRSSLSSVWTTTAFQSGLQRSTIVTVGMQKSFTGIPAPFQSIDHSHTIEGLVFRDENMNGVCDPGEHGIEAIEVRLDGGAAMTTDRDGRYRFAGVSGDMHRLSIDSAQFATPVRMTTLSEQTIDLASTRRAIVNFGLVDFARIAGSVFNDLRFEGKRQPDSPPIADVRLLLTRDGQPRRTIAVRADGTFNVDDIVPGDYELAIDADTVPADYSVPVDRVRIHAAPTASVPVDFALRALRSLAGHVYVRSSTGALVPLQGVQVTVDHTIARTDADGAFVLRDLPAGNLNVTLLPLRPLPANVSVPSGPIHMPPDPIHVEGATIVISNPDLVAYLTGAPAVVGGANDRR
ncbi:MAG TPA: SdrD B-like domain-containing protein, partial [Thermoanaerobaculia bacterium]|nr:SdrD B-like domain-containing protein [Thermoanaerobaculia bacterium]